MPDARAVLDEFLDAIEAMDARRITAALAEDVTLETEALPEPVRGKAVLDQLLGAALGAYESVRIERRKVVSSGRDAAAFVRAHARFRSDLELLGEILPTAGLEVDIAAALFVEVDDAGKIQRVLRVRDTLAVTRQLGLSPDQMNRLAQKFQEQITQRQRRAA